MTSVLLSIQIDWALFLEKLLLILGITVISLVFAMYSTYAERKVAGFIQDRYGPDRFGPMGIFQPFADAIKLFFKEEFIPSHANKFLFIMGPALSMSAALMTSAVIPWGEDMVIAGRTVSLQVAEINVAVLYIFAVVALGVYGVMIGGWSSNNKFSLMGAVRGVSQTISYELAMGLAIIALILVNGTLSIREMVEYQQANYWNVVYQPLGFIIFLICSFAETHRTPFDLPEAESELNFGYHLEYSSMKLGFYLFTDYTHMFMSGIILSTFYFGGYDIPFFNEETSSLSPNLIALLGVVTLLIKAIFFIFFYMWVRWTVPRFRYDQLMNLGWNKLIPLALLNMVLTAVIVLWIRNGSPF